MEPMRSITIQTHLEVDGHRRWVDAAVVEIAGDAAAGHRAASVLSYEISYWAEIAAGLDEPPVDLSAVSCHAPVDLAILRQPRWPSFLLDMMPQGVARKTLADRLGLDADKLQVELPLLLHAGGSPVGNVRIREAWEAEQDRIKGMHWPPLLAMDFLTRTETFIEVMADFALLASGSTGLQGEWPKIMLTLSKQDGHWYPDSVVEDQDAADHIIVKTMPPQGNPASELILASEAPYLEVARAFGLRCGAALSYSNGALVIPRFDRQRDARGVVRHGQESLVSACGIAAFGHVTTHEAYLDVIRSLTTDPGEEVVEYVLRDLLATAAGDPDNHGRNTALQKHVDGSIRLTPVFDFTPMRLDTRGIVRSTRWACARHHPPQAEDIAAMCHAAAEGLATLDPAMLLRRLRERTQLFADLPHIARARGVPQETLERAMLNHESVAASLLDARL